MICGETGSPAFLGRGIANGLAEIIFPGGASMRNKPFLDAPRERKIGMKWLDPIHIAGNKRRGGIKVLPIALHDDKILV